MCSAKYTLMINVVIFFHGGKSSTYHIFYTLSENQPPAEAIDVHQDHCTSPHGLILALDQLTKHRSPKSLHSFTAVEWRQGCFRKPEGDRLACSPLPVHTSVSRLLG